MSIARTHVLLFWHRWRHSRRNAGPSSRALTFVMSIARTHACVAFLIQVKAQQKKCRAELKGVDFCDVDRTHACVAFLTQVKARQKKCRAGLSRLVSFRPLPEPWKRAWEWCVLYCTFFCYELEWCAVLRCICYFLLLWIGMVRCIALYMLISSAWIEMVRCLCYSFVTRSENGLHICCWSLRSMPGKCVCMCVSCAAFAPKSLLETSLHIQRLTLTSTHTHREDGMHYNLVSVAQIMICTFWRA